MDEKEPSAAELYFVGKKDELIKAKRSFRTLEGRDILIILHQGDFYAIDLYCYHAGSSLENGDIEEIDSKLCIICPKHKYKISLSEGEGLYKARDHTQQPSVLRWFSKGVKQRVHAVIEDGEDVFVKLSDRGYIESDFYQGEKGRVEREKAANQEEGDQDS